MKKIILVSLLAFGLTTSAIANDNGEGVYFGLGYGSTAFDDDNIRISNLKDDSDNGVKIYGGYQFNKIVGVEATYTDYGKFSYPDAEISAPAVSVAANLGYNFLDAQLRPFALVGLSHLNISQSGTPIYDDDDTIAFSYGIGIEYAPTVLNGIGFRAEWNADIFTVTKLFNDEDYVQAFGMFNVAVQYKF